jgi:hypothetical protein
MGYGALERGGEAEGSGEGKAREVLPKPLNPTFFVKSLPPAFLNCIFFQALHFLLC